MQAARPAPRPRGTELAARRAESAGPRPQRSIRGRILAAFVLSLAAWLGAFGYTLAQLQAVGEGIAVLDTGYLPLADVAARTEATARQLDQDHARFSREAPRALAGARASAALYRASLEEAARRGHEVAEAAARTAPESADAAAFEAAAQAFSAIGAQAQAYEESVITWAEAAAAAPDAASPTTDERVAVGAEEARALSDMGLLRTQLVGTASDLSALVDGRIQRVSERTASAQRRALAVGGGAGLLAIAMAALMAGAALLTLRPIAQLTRQVQRIAAGEEAGRVEIRSADEVGLLANEFNAMADAVAERDRRLSERAAALDALSLRLRRILDTIHAGLVVVEEDRATTVNPAATALWDLHPGDALPPALAGLAPGRHEALELGGGGESPPRLFDVEVVPFGAAGRLVVGEDVTDRVRDRERLARSERLALVGQMLAQITHEVRNPLNAMSLHAELLADELQEAPPPPDGPSSDAAAILDTIATEIARLEQVTARYLDLSRRREPELSPENVTALVRGVLQTDEEVWRRAGAEVALEGEVPGVVELAGDTLRRAVRNLVRNAAEAGAAHITVSLSRAGDAVHVDVGDDGPGIPEEALRRVFDPFFTTKVKGTGLGLAISRQELEEAGGSLSVRSGDGAGTTFRITLPGRWEEPGDPSEDDSMSVA